MSKITIWNNSKCSKSRATMALLEEKNLEIDIVNYLDISHSKEDLKTLLSQLGFSARELMRKGEDIYKELGLSNVNDEEALIDAMITNPKLIERPIVIKDNKAVIGRPIENVIALIS